MSLTTGQREYLLELLSHEYVLTGEQQPLVRQAICRYATTVYDQKELDYLVAMPQSPAALPANTDFGSTVWSIIFSRK